MEKRLFSLLLNGVTQSVLAFLLILILEKRSMIFRN